MSFDAMDIQTATQADGDALWAMLEPVFRAGETYPIDRDIAREDALAYWLAPGHRTYLARSGGRAQGTYYLRANNGGGGAHVCNCGYVVARCAQGRGVARRMAEHSFIEARGAGYSAMQFNFVIASNHRALRLWVPLGLKPSAVCPGPSRIPRAAASTHL